MSDFQSSVLQLAPFLWLHCDTDPSTCGLSRVGSVRIRQWRRLSAANSSCFSSSQFSSSCLNTYSSSVSGQVALPITKVILKNVSLDISSDGEINVLLGSTVADEALWDAMFKPNTPFLTTGTTRIEVAATIFSPKHRHFVSFEIAAVLDGGFSQSRCHIYASYVLSFETHSQFSVIECLISRAFTFLLQELGYVLQFLSWRYWRECGIY